LGRNAFSFLEVQVLTVMVTLSKVETDEMVTKAVELKLRQRALVFWLRKHEVSVV
jgi:hypothetical protein